MKEIIQDLKEAWKWLGDWLYLRRHAIRLRLAMSLADMKQRAYNKRYFVVVAVTGRDKYGRERERLVSINKDDFKVLKRRKWLPRDMDYLKLAETCFYQTPLSRNNKLCREEQMKAREKYLRYARKNRR